MSTRLYQAFVVWIGMQMYVVKASWDLSDSLAICPNLFWWSMGWLNKEFSVCFCHCWIATLPCGSYHGFQSWQTFHVTMAGIYLGWICRTFLFSWMPCPCGPLCCCLLSISSHSSFWSLHCSCASSFSLMNLKYSQCSCKVWLNITVIIRLDWTDGACCCHCPRYGGGMCGLYCDCAKSGLACGTRYWLYCWLKVCSVGGLTCWLTCGTGGVGCLGCWPWQFGLYCALLTISVGVDLVVDWLCSCCWGDCWMKCAE